MQVKQMIFEYPADFARRLKAAAAMADKSMKDFVMDAVEEKIEREEQEDEKA